mgnify:CR=1 FL=1
MELSPEEEEQLDIAFKLVDKTGTGVISDKDTIIMLRYLGLFIEDKEIIDKGNSFNFDEIKNIYGNKMYVVKEGNTLEVIDENQNVYLQNSFEDISEININNFRELFD